MMKMYILIIDSIPDGFAPLVSAHCSLATYLKYEKDTDCIAWVHGIFKKVVCKVSQEELEEAKKIEKSLVITESALNNKQVAIGFCPRETYPEVFKEYKLWKPRRIKI